MVAGFLIQSLPKSMTIAPVTLGDFARASGCGSDPSVELEMVTGWRRSERRACRGDIHRAAAFTSALGAATGLSLPPNSWMATPMGSLSRPRVAAVRRPPSAAGRTTVHTSTVVPTACAALPGESTDVWRLWHTSGLADSGACDSLTSITGFETSLPSGLGGGRQGRFDSLSQHDTRTLRQRRRGDRRGRWGKLDRMSVPAVLRTRRECARRLVLRAAVERSRIGRVASRLVPATRRRTQPSGENSSVSAVGDTSATLSGEVNPQGRRTEYQFVIGSNLSLPVGPYAEYYALLPTTAIAIGQGRASFHSPTVPTCCRPQRISGS